MYVYDCWGRLIYFKILFYGMEIDDKIERFIDVFLDVIGEVNSFLR